MNRVETDAKVTIPTTVSYLTSTESRRKVSRVIDESFGRFVEQEKYLQEKFEYSRRFREPGKIIIFNQENFKHRNFRSGSRRDVNEIIICLQRLGYNIGKEDIHNDLTTEQIKDELETVSKSDLLQVNCLIVFFLTHGDDDNRLYTYDDSLTTFDVWNAFARSIDLDGKPKLFIFQACKGEESSTTGKASVEKDNVDIIHHSTFSNYFMPDMLICYSTVEGTVSYRNPLLGSWFIQELCKNFSTYAWKEDMISLLTRTSKCISRNYYYQDYEVKKQMPLFISTLRKKFYLNRNKHRNALLYTIDTVDDIHNKVKDIQHKVNKIYEKETSK